MKRLFVLLLATGVIACTTGGTVAQSTSTPAQTATATIEPLRTLAPTPTPTVPAALVAKVNVPVTYTDGWKVVVLSSAAHPPARFSTPAPGMQFIAVVVRYENGSTKESSFNLFSWKLQDSVGVRRNPSFFNDRSDSLGSGKLAPGAFVQGSVVFEAPVGDQRLSVIYEDFGYKQATWELY